MDSADAEKRLPQTKSCSHGISPSVNRSDLERNAPAQAQHQGSAAVCQTANPRKASRSQPEPAVSGVADAWLDAWKRLQDGSRLYARELDATGQDGPERPAKQPALLPEDF